MEVLQTHGEHAFLVDRRAFEVEAQEGVGRLVILDDEAFGQLVEFGVFARERFVAEHAHHHVLHLGAGGVDQMYGVIVGEAGVQVALGDHGPQFLVADAAGAEQEDVHAQRLLQHVGEQVAQLRLAEAVRMGQLADELRDDAAVLVVRAALVVVDHVRDGLVLRAGLGIDGDGRPAVAVDAVLVGVDQDVEAADLVGAGARLHDGDAVDDGRLRQEGVGMSADDDVHAPFGLQQGCQFLIFLEADVGQQDGEVDIDRVVGVADAADLFRRVLDVDEAADQAVRLALLQRHVGDDADEQDLHAVDLDDVVGLEESGAVRRDVQVRVDDGELRALFQEQQVGDAVVDFVVANGDHVWPQHVHDLDGGKSFEFGVDDGSAEHVAGDGVDHVLVVFSRPVDVAGQQRQAADQIFIHVLRQEISVHVVGVEEGELLKILHGLLLSCVYAFSRKAR